MSFYLVEIARPDGGKEHWYRVLGVVEGYGFESGQYSDFSYNDRLIKNISTWFHL